MRPARALRRSLAGTLALASVAGCAGQAGTHGRDDTVTAVHAMTTLSTELPDRLPIPAVVAAAESTLLDAGYTIRDSQLTEVKGRVEAIPPDRGIFEKVVVKSEVGRWGTRIKVRIDPLGDEPRARTILDGMLFRLGR